MAGRRKPVPVKEPVDPMIKVREIVTDVVGQTMGRLKIRQWVIGRGRRPNTLEVKFWVEGQKFLVVVAHDPNDKTRLQRDLGEVGRVAAREMRGAT